MEKWSGSGMEEMKGCVERKWDGRDEGKSGQEVGWR